MQQHWENPHEWARRVDRERMLPLIATGDASEGAAAARRSRLRERILAYEAADCYIIPDPDGTHTAGVRFGPGERDYIGMDVTPSQGADYLVLSSFPKEEAEPLDPEDMGNLLAEIGTEYGRLMSAGGANSTASPLVRDIIAWARFEGALGGYHLAKSLRHALSFPHCEVPTWPEVLQHALPRLTSSQYADAPFTALRRVIARYVARPSSMGADEVEARLRQSSDVIVGAVCIGVRVARGVTPAFIPKLRGGKHAQ
ncbi:MAG: hypothetical protein EBT64_06755 [Gammaproteobacteria bacterium]|nr:hypothetical protein [Gammaproteobacteria bacterium]